MADENATCFIGVSLLEIPVESFIAEMSQHCVKCFKNKEI